MHSFVAHKWACLALLWGFSTTLARPYEDDNLFALAPGAGDSPFTSDTLPIDGGSEPLVFDDNFPPGSLDFSNLDNENLLGFDQTPSSGFDIAYATGDCKYGEVVGDVGTVAFDGACPAEYGKPGCGRTMDGVVNFDSRLKSLCAVGNQKCCGGVSSAVFDGLSDCHAVPQVAQSNAILDFLNHDVGQDFQGGWGALMNGNPGGSLGGGGNPLQNLLNIFGVGQGASEKKKKKRAGDFCAAPGYN